MTMLAERVAFVIGVDTYKHRNTAAVVNRNGGVLQTVEVAASRPGYRQLPRLAEQAAEGCRVRAVEGTGSFEAGLTSFLRVRGEWVIEIDRPQRSPRRRGKSDTMDAIRAAREALSRDKLAQPRLRGPREGLRILQTTGGHIHLVAGIEVGEQG